MTEIDNVLIFLCSGTTKTNNKKLSHKIALQLQEMNVGEIGSLEMLKMQLESEPKDRKRMIFINDCNSSCVKLLTHGFDPTQFLYVDVAPYKHQEDFDIAGFIEENIINKI